MQIVHNANLFLKLRATNSITVGDARNHENTITAQSQQILLTISAAPYV